VQSSPLSVVERAAKRTFDVLFALTALVLLSPILLIVAVAIKLDSHGPVLFLQRRRGHANRPFRIVKFRSMSVLEDGAEIRQATAVDPRVTRVGAFIRTFSIDELPQFLNVLKGDMSVVGPRPHAIAHDDLYDRLIAEYASRRYVKPGVTGWAQIHGHRGETLTVEAMEQRVQYDRWYIDNWSLWLDLKIAIRTVFALRGY
jgi:exopolysaccharide biosynthesis polyprenyl glycosylphosphotransferase